MKIAKKMLLTFGIIVLILVVIAGDSLFAIHGNKSDFQRFYSQAYQLTNQTNETDAVLQAADAALEENQEGTERASILLGGSPLLRLCLPFAPAFP